MYLPNDFPKNMSTPTTNGTQKNPLNDTPQGNAGEKPETTPKDHLHWEDEEELIPDRFGRILLAERFRKIRKPSALFPSLL